MLSRPSPIEAFDTEERGFIHGKAERSEQGGPSQREAWSAYEFLYRRRCEQKRRIDDEGNSGQYQRRRRYRIQERNQIGSGPDFGRSWLWLLSGQGHFSDPGKSFGGENVYGRCYVRKESLEGYSQRLSRSCSGPSGLQGPGWRVQGRRAGLDCCPAARGPREQASEASPWGRVRYSLLRSGEPCIGQQVTSTKINIRSISFRVRIFYKGSECFAALRAFF